MRIRPWAPPLPPTVDHQAVLLPADLRHRAVVAHLQGQAREGRRSGHQQRQAAPGGQGVRFPRGKPGTLERPLART